MKLQGIIEKQPYKCGIWPNHNVTYGIIIYITFQEYISTTKPLVLIPILSNKNLNVKNDDLINGNDISTYNQANGSNGELQNWVW